eukprot:TRINITY_DN2723_c0_g1_i1.p1 TRINITY_DN2723_c0_g1~~TRINITY_DN2723_c0_g1_i1.p1  ORF type:complete len:250 (-),score=39.38 TRINITY_DN2723_c0_g1_i1:911-1612(-)
MISLTGAVALLCVLSLTLVVHAGKPACDALPEGTWNAAENCFCFLVDASTTRACLPVVQFGQNQIVAINTAYRSLNFYPTGQLRVASYPPLVLDRQQNLFDQLVDYARARSAAHTFLWSNRRTWVHFVIAFLYNMGIECQNTNLADVYRGIAAEASAQQVTRVKGQLRTTCKRFQPRDATFLTTIETMLDTFFKADDDCKDFRNKIAALTANPQIRALLILACPNEAAAAHVQ